MKTMSLFAGVALMGGLYLTATAQDQKPQEHVDPTDQAYRGAPSPLAEEPMVHSIHIAATSRATRASTAASSGMSGSIGSISVQGGEQQPSARTDCPTPADGLWSVAGVARSAVARRGGSRTC